MNKSIKEENVPILFYPWDGEGICGVSTLSSAFHYIFGNDFAAKKLFKKEDELKVVNKAKKRR